MQNDLARSVLYILVSVWTRYAVTAVSSSAFKGWEHWSIIFPWILKGIELNSTFNALEVIPINKDIRKHITNLMDKF